MTAFAAFATFVVIGATAPAALHFIRNEVPMWEDFEYLALLCKNLRKRFPRGAYPRRAAPLPEP